MVRRLSACSSASCMICWENRLSISLCLPWGILVEDSAVLGSLQWQRHYCNVTPGLPLVRSVFCLSRRPLFLVIVPLPWLGFAIVWPKGDLYSVPGFIITELNIRSFCGLLSLDGASTNEEELPSDEDRHSKQEANCAGPWQMSSKAWST